MPTNHRSGADIFIFFFFVFLKFRFYMHHITNSMKWINQLLYDTNPNNQISFTISKYHLFLSIVSCSTTKSTKD